MSKRTKTQLPDNIGDFGKNMKSGSQSRFMNEIIKQQELTDEHTKLLADARLEAWKQLQTPATWLADQLVNLQTIIQAKQLKGEDPTSQEILQASRLLLDFAKEFNRLQTLSADKRADMFSKFFDGSGEDFVFDLRSGGDEKDGSN